MFCPDCGHELQEGHAFCKYCGARLDDADGAQTEVKPTAVASASETVTGTDDALASPSPAPPVDAAPTLPPPTDTTPPLPAAQADPASPPPVDLAPVAAGTRPPSNNKRVLLIIAGVVVGLLVGLLILAVAAAALFIPARSETAAGDASAPVAIETVETVEADRPRDHRSNRGHDHADHPVVPSQQQHRHRARYHPGRR